MHIFDDYLLNPEQRIYWLYLLSAFGISLVYYWVQPKPKVTHINTIYGELKAYWLHPSALLDYRYFIAVWLIKLYILLPLLLSAKTVTLYVNLLLLKIHTPLHLQFSALTISLLYTITLFISSEFSRYWLHRWLHTVPLLWQFHKVHHSAEILTPLTFYRVHPVENFLFGLRYAFTAGIVTGLFLWLFGSGLSLYMIGGTNAFIWGMSLIGSNLRHSHIYLRYPKFLERWFISPAQHQLHHTYKYCSKNYGGYLGIFDRLFGTLQLSENINKPTQYGFPKKLAKRYSGLTNLLIRPFIDCKTLWKRKHEKI
ncbi:sterol desaturase/sphingolipid hydroxylase (fatty acid hydroxylase superfamily) [Bisgaardia hudsonensis]|uniref:Sterol desaturase/sphingolipid hydroxylase (Fatty acid hydroxylase superfamily) n=1 Tax=Bisgaardia hudsonensis TaxID=109472 RepID=A0A4R2N088_9PAST|nr:sterol desaturase family protein [Bisgaardia hudsonensis]QLB13400.1 hypothetical protein A6A11_07155 [Bisgaardia hudsonensis]TCP12804.1 sterol desaturase/sphingolipid hydroxylase (fatty acid hydroxylase superfamily) [Bisgaardia hudsonensis]